MTFRRGPCGAQIIPECEGHAFLGKHDNREDRSACRNARSQTDIMLDDVSATQMAHEGPSGPTAVWQGGADEAARSRSTKEELPGTRPKPKPQHRQKRRKEEVDEVMQILLGELHLERLNESDDENDQGMTAHITVHKWVNGQEACAINEQGGSGGREELEVMIDSGAAETVMPLNWLPRHPAVESKGSQEGVYYRAATGEPVFNEGERALGMCTSEGQYKRMIFQAAATNKLSGSGPRICANKNIAVSDDDGCSILNKDIGHAETGRWRVSIGCGSGTTERISGASNTTEREP